MDRWATRILAASSVVAAGVMLLSPASAQEPPPPPVNPAPVSPPPVSPPPVSPPPANPAPPPARKHRRLRLPQIGLDYGVFIPRGQKTRDRFGATWTSFGIGFGSFSRPSIGGHFSPDFSLIHRASGRSYIYAVPLGVTYRRELVGRRFYRPFVGGSLDLEPVDLRSEQDNVHSGLRLADAASGFLGITLGSRGLLRARYTVASSASGFNLSGLNLSAGIRF